MPVTHVQLTAPVLVPPGKLMVTVEEAAKLLSLSRTRVYGLLGCKRLQSVKVGGVRRIPIGALQQFVDTLCAGEEVREGDVSKQGNGEGSIRKRDDGRWEARLVLADVKRKSLYGQTRHEVARALAAAIRDRDHGLVAQGDCQTVEHYLTSWLAATKHTVQPSSYLRYEREVRLRLVPALGKVLLSKLTAQQVQTLCTRELERGLSSTSVRHMFAVLHDALDDAVRLGLVYRNVADLVDAPRVRPFEMLPLMAEQARALLAAAAGDRFEALYVLALATGMRRGELLALRWRDVDLDACVLQVQSNLQLGLDGWVLAKPKTKQSRRRIALSPNVVAALRAHRRRQTEERACLGDAWVDLDLVFPRADGGLMWPWTLVRGSFRSLLLRASLPHIRFHDLRHTAATLLLSCGVNVKVVSEMLGHANVTITLNIYGHVLPHMQEQAAATMDGLLWQGLGSESGSDGRVE